MSSSSSSSFIYSSSSSSSDSSGSSSSSSIDSSSTSSESIGNVSSSSSSSMDVWNRGKPFILGNTAISDVSTQNRLAQTIHVLDSTYSIGSVYCYLMGTYGSDTSYTINMSVYTCDDDATPLAQIATTSIDASIINGNDWYKFDFDISGTTPSNNYMAFVLWQDGGDEDSYVLWAYDYYIGSSTSSEIINQAWISKDSINWVADWNVSRSLRITGTYQAFNLVDKQVESPPSTEKDTQLLLGGRNPSYQDTELLSGDLVVNYPNLLTSIVVDNSGSMGWNDRFATRQEIVGDIVDRLQQYYPSDVLFDFITFGSKVAKTTSVNSNLGQVMTINLDANSPTRRTYVFTIGATDVYEGDVYTNNGYTFTVDNTITGATTLYCTGTGVPLDEGTLDKQSGSGDTSMLYTAVEYSNADHSLVAYGFKNLIDGRTYTVGQVAVDGTSVSAPSITNWELYHPNTEAPSISLSEDGPADSESISIGATTSLVSRKLFLSNPIVSSKLTQDVLQGSNVASVVDASLFLVNNKIDIVNGNAASMSHSVVASNSISNQITFETAVEFKLLDEASDNGRVEVNFNSLSRSINGTTIQLLVKEPLSVSTTITFFLQTISGRFIEWDFVPFDDWKYDNLFWLDETALLPITIVDDNNDPFPDGTKVILEVDNRVTLDGLGDASYEATLLTIDASIGDTKLYVGDLTGYTKDAVIDVMDDDNNIQTVTIKSVGTDGTGYYLEIYEPLQYDFLIANSAKVIVNDKGAAILSDDSQIALSLPIVDVTPIITGKNLNPALLQPYDKTPVDYTDTYESLNYSREHIQKGTADVPTIDGFASIRMLPITEDVLRTNSEKDRIAENILRGQPSSVYTSQTEQEDGDFDSIEIPTTTTDSTTVEGEDYVIESPVYLLSGHAESAMKSTATDLDITAFDGFNIPGVPTTDNATSMFAKAYTIYPAIIEETNNGVITALQYFDDFEVSFASPINIYSNVASQTVPFYCEDISDDGICQYFRGYSKTNYTGTFAGDGPFTIEYIVSDKGILIDNETLTVKIYSNKVDGQEGVANSIAGRSAQTSQLINITYSPVNTVVDGVTQTVQPLSDIDQWREAVANNPMGERLESDYNPNYNELRSHYDELGVTEETENADPLEEYDFYADAIKWTDANQYTVNEVTLNIVNGKATLEIPANEDVSTLFVEASYTFGDRYEAIRADLIFVANPLSIGALTPTFITPTGAVEDTYEIGGGITWKDGTEGVIEDNTTVNFFPESTIAQPSVSVTDNGWAGGVLLGPHDEVVFSLDEEALCPPISLKEVVTIEIVHSSGYINTLKRRVEWNGEIDNELDQTFYFHATGSGSGWADGSSGTSTIINSDLHDTQNLLWVTEEGIERLEGLGQFEDEPSWVYASPAIPNQVRWNANGIPLNWSIINLNQNIGNSPIIYESAVSAPWNREVSMSTRYKDENGHGHVGYGVTAFPYPSPSLQLILPRPLSESEEPLAISVTIESLNDAYSRDGVDTANIVATVTWKEEPITSNFPFTRFEIGKCSEINSTGGEKAQYIDYRGDFAGCLTMTKHSDANLNIYSVQISLSRTDIHTDLVNTHTHSCTVDDNRAGTTESTITLKGVVVDHTHGIVNDEAQASVGYTDTHTHDLRSVAITTLQPTTNTELDISINGFVEYDPTNCTPYSGLGNGSNDSPVGMPTVGNRMMFSTYTAPGYVPTNSDLMVELEILSNSNASSSMLPTFYAAKNPGDTDRGFDIVANAYFSSYVTEFMGSPVIMPARKVDDGSRLTLNVEVFRPESSVKVGSTDDVGTNVTVSGPDIVKDYMILKVKADIASEGKYGSSEATIEINSNLRWLPHYTALNYEPTNDALYISNATSYSANVGSSQLYDAIRFASQRMISYQTSNANVQSYTKTIFLLTDGDENSSQYSIDQAIDSVSFVDRDKGAQVIPVRLGQSYSADEVVLTKIYKDTNGFILSSLDLTSSAIDDMISYLFSHPSLAFGNGTYGNTFDLERPSIPSSLFLQNVTATSNQNVEFRYRTSEDGIQWGIWSSWKKYTEEHTIAEIIDSLTQYFEYEIKLFGDEYFSSPVCEEDITCRYFKPSDFVIFFQPQGVGGSDNSGYGIEEGQRFVSSVHVTHEADLPLTSTVEYGITQSDNTEFDTFYNIIDPDKQAIMLTRYNEPLITEDNREYTALNGNWPDGVGTSIYKINDQNPNGKLIEPNEYSSNNINGTITFYNTQVSTDSFIICIEVSPSFRLACKVVNYGSDSAVIHHIGVIYNMMKRIPTDNTGNIIHTPISTRIL